MMPFGGHVSGILALLPSDSPPLLLSHTCFKNLSPSDVQTCVPCGNKYSTLFLVFVRKNRSRQRTLQQGLWSQWKALSPDFAAETSLARLMRSNRIRNQGRNDAHSIGTRRFRPERERRDPRRSCPAGRQDFYAISRPKIQSEPINDPALTK